MDLALQARGIKAKIIKRDHIKLKNFCIVKETISKVKGLLPEREKILGNDVSDKRLISKIYKEAMQLNIKKKKRITKPSKNRAEDLNRHFSKEDIQVVKGHMKRCSTSLIIMEIRLKTTMRHHLTLVRMALIEKASNKC